MFHDLKLGDERGRLCAVARYDIMDTPSEPQFDNIVSLLKTIFKVPIALISVIDDRRQWYKAVEGLAITEIPGTRPSVIIRSSPPTSSPSRIRRSIPVSPTTRW